MASEARGKLYSRDLLSLAVRLADFPYREDWPDRGEARSRACGSSVVCSIRTRAGVIADVGLAVSACAVGQAAAAIFASHAKGLSGDDLARVASQLDDWLGSDAAKPDWPEIGLLEPARAFPARHGAILLPWNAAQRALCNTQGLR